MGPLKGHCDIFKVGLYELIAVTKYISHIRSLLEQYIANDMCKFAEMFLRKWEDLTDVSCGYHSYY